MPRVRLRVLAASAALMALPLGALSFTGTAVALAGPQVAESGTPAPEPTCQVLGCIPTGSPTPDSTGSPTPEPIVVPTTAAPTVSPTPSRTFTPQRTASPRPRATYRETVTSTASPVTGGVDIGLLPPATEASPSPTSVAASTAGSSGKLGALITLVVGAGLVLGAGGAAGLYLTRHRHDS